MVAVASGLNLTCDIPVTADSAMDGHPGGADPPRNNFKGKNQSCKTFEELNITNKNIPTSKGGWYTCMYRLIYATFQYVIMGI